jgi:hypothetical protein
VLDGLRELYPAPNWALVPEVRAGIGASTDLEVLRAADAIAVHLWPAASAAADGWRLHGFEIRVSRSEWLREIAQPVKSGPLKLFCAAWYVVVPSPWKHIVVERRELPDRWGLIEIDAGAPRIVVPAIERIAEPPTSAFLRALLRAAVREPQRIDPLSSARGRAPR